ncbi:MAG: PTS sugar transporter subunit IIA [Candidatus Tenebribacter burtonii]|nr:PTS sugar transporter subunit IIA [Candidatus Tenebribacter burtonii]
MDIEKILLTECIEISSQKEDKNSLLKNISNLAKNNPTLNNISEEDIYKALAEREDMGSTAISSRIAIPHCRLKGIDDFVIGILISKDGVDFDAIDNKNTFVFVFIIAPANRQKEHVRLLSFISQYLRKDENISKLINAKDTENIRASIIRHTSMPKDIKQTDKYKLVTVVIQNENKFENILNVINEFEGSNIAIIEASNAGRYLYHMPLFTSFMQTDRNNFCRIISATVESEFIDDLTNNLAEIVEEKESGIMFFIQNIKYLHGSLEIW